MVSWVHEFLHKKSISISFRRLIKNAPFSDRTLKCCSSMFDPVCKRSRTRSSPDVRSVTCSESSGASKPSFPFTNPGAQTEKRTQLTTGENKPHQHQILFFRSLEINCQRNALLGRVSKLQHVPANEGRRVRHPNYVHRSFRCVVPHLEMRTTKLFFLPNCCRYRKTCHQ